MDPAKRALLDFLLDDDFSSSSSDSDWGSLEELNDSGLSDLEFHYLTSDEQDFRSKIYFKHNSTDGTYRTEKMEDSEFFEEFRVNRTLVEELASKYGDSSFFNYQAGKHGKLAAYDELLMFLWFAGHNVAFRELSEKFDVTNSTCHRVVRRVAAFLRSILDIIKWPEGDDVMESSLYFKLKGLPLVMGAINLTHIEIDKPLKDYEEFRNVSKKFSVQLQVICDHKKKIIHLYAGAPGSETVTEVFEGSGLSDGLQDACGDYCILGDNGYPCLRNLLAPYHDDVLTMEQEAFNQLLTVGRSIVYDCFAILRKKFPQLNHCRIRATEDINNFITACCVLYNLSIDDNFLADIAAERPDHNSHYFLTNADRDGRQFDASLTDTAEGVEYRDQLLAALKLGKC